MKTVLVLENGLINEYKICYNQRYMNSRLEEYRRNFSCLRQFKTLTSNAWSMDEIKNRMKCFNNIVLYSIATSKDDGSAYEISFIGSINPPLYNILSDKYGNFVLNNKNIGALIAWYQAVQDNCDDVCEKRNSDVEATDDYFNLNEKNNFHDNIANLLDGVTLSYVKSVPDCDSDDFYETAKRNSDFINEVGITIEKNKTLVK